MKALDLNKPEYFYNRELSWLKFNLRVLKEASQKDIPLLERLKFIAITASNLDEFFMVRVASLWDNFDNGIDVRDASGLSVKEQLDAISEAAHDQVKTQSKYLLALIKEMRGVGLHLKRVTNLTDFGKEWLEEYYREMVYPVLTPMAVDASRPFPFLANKTLNLAIELINSEGEHNMGLVQVLSTDPVEVRYLPISSNAGAVKKFKIDKYTDFNIQIQEIFASRMVMPNEFTEFYYLIEIELLNCHHP